MRPLLLLPVLTIACTDTTQPDHDHDHAEGELITTVELTLTDSAGASQTVRWADPENDGDPIIDPQQLGPGHCRACGYPRFLSGVNETTRIFSW